MATLQIDSTVLKLSIAHLFDFDLQRIYTMTHQSQCIAQQNNKSAQLLSQLSKSATKRPCINRYPSLILCDATFNES
jgi:hypothetical protein